MLAIRPLNAIHPLWWWDGVKWCHYVFNSRNFDLKSTEAKYFASVLLFSSLTNILLSNFPWNNFWITANKRWEVFFLLTWSSLWFDCWNSHSLYTCSLENCPLNHKVVFESHLMWSEPKQETEKTWWLHGKIWKRN